MIDLIGKYKIRTLILVSIILIAVISIVLFLDFAYIGTIPKVLILLIFSIAIAFYVSKKISQPIEEIKKSAEEYSQGKFDKGITINAPMEIENLAIALQKMGNELKKRIDKISLQKNEQEAMFSSMKEGVLAINSNEEIIRINNAAIKFFGISSSPLELKRRKVYEVIRNREMLDFIGESLKSDEPLEKEITAVSNKERNLLVYADPLYDSTSEKIGSVLVINNITKVKQLDKVRQEFVANVSHELKTPITLIKGYVETLHDSENLDKETENKFLKIINKHSEQLNSLIDDLLQLAKLDAANEIKMERKSLLPIVQKSVEQFEENAKKKNIEIKIECDPELKANINASLIERALVNLIDNAIKYSEENNSVIISCKEGNDSIEISVADTGVGIAKEHLDRLFERFYRVDKGRSREMGGTGLGLAIVKHVALVHKGKVAVESTPGKGSVFTIELPK